MFQITLKKNFIYLKSTAVAKIIIDVSFKT